MNQEKNGTLFKKNLEPVSYLPVAIILSKFSGLMPFSRRGIFYTVVIVLCLVMNLAAGYIYLAENISDMNVMTYQLPIWTLLFGGAYNCIKIVSNRQDYIAAVNEVMRDFPDGMKRASNEAKQELNGSHGSFRTVCITALIAMVMWMLGPVFVEESPFPMGAHFPFSTEDSGAYIGVYIFQGFAIFMSTVITMGTNCIYAEVALHTSVHFNDLCNTLLSARKANNESKYNCQENILGEVLSVCVYRHDRLLRRIVNMERIHSSILLVNSLRYLTCLTIMALLIVGSPGEVHHYHYVVYVGFLLAAVTEWYILSLAGYHLTEAQSEISRALFEHQWISSPEKVKRILNIIGLRAHVPIRASVGSIAALNLTTYGETMAKAYSFLTVLYQFKNK